MKFAKYELLSPPRYGQALLHVGLAGSETSLCNRNTERWMIVQGPFDTLRVTCPACRKRVDHLLSDKESTDGVVNVAIVGSRTFAPLRIVCDYVAKLQQNVHVISGGARGVDEVAARAAMLRGLKTTILKADWDRYGQRAGIFRNTNIAELLEPGRDRLVAFWDQSSSGTGNMISQAKKRGIQVIIHRNDGIYGEYFY